MWVECPYCGENIEVNDSNLECLNSDNYIEYYECDSCGKEFDIYVEFDPIGSAVEITYNKCDCCGKEDKERNFYKRGRTFPFPDDKKYSTLCHSCHTTLMFDQWESENDKGQKNGNN